MVSYLVGGSVEYLEIAKVGCLVELMARMRVDQMGHYLVLLWVEKWDATWVEWSASLMALHWAEWTA